jgi:hypothetical protein
VEKKRDTNLAAMNAVSGHLSLGKQRLKFFKYFSPFISVDLVIEHHA